MPALTDSEYWRFADAEYRLEFPRDHANHPDYRLESWTFAANLQSKEGRAFASQVRFVRAGLNFKPDNASRWAVRDLYFTQWTITDESGKRFLHGDRINRAAIGWAGAESERMRVWNEDWEAAETPAGEYRLRAAGIDLAFERGKSPVLHGENGFMQKGEFSLNATKFYSLSRMPVRGEIVIDGRRVEVAGNGWMDHEFGASTEEKDQAGWDRFAIQFDDGSELLLLRFRNLAGAGTPRSFATWVSADGKAQSIPYDQFRLDSAGQWISPESRAVYPAEWRLQVPGRALDLKIRPLLADQEIRGSDAIGGPFWQGAVRTEGTLAGRGYAELTGYASR